MSQHRRKSSLSDIKVFNHWKSKIRNIDFSDYHPKKLLTMDWNRLHPKFWDWNSILNIILVSLFSLLISFYFIIQELLSKFSDRDQLLDIEILGLGFYIISIIGLAFYFYKRIDWKSCIKLGIGYFIYLVTSYFILVTRNLNNESFQPDRFDKNHFWQMDALPTILLIVSIAFLIRFIINKFDAFKKYNTNVLEELPLSWLLASIIAPVLSHDRLFVDFLAGSVNSLLDQGRVIDVLASISSILVFNSSILLLVYYCFFNSISDVKVNRASFSLVVTTSLTLAIIFNYCLQYGVRGDTDLLGRYIFPGATSFQIVFLFVVYLFIYLILNRYLISTFLIVSLGSAISIVNILKQDMRSEPLLITDFVWLQEPSLLLGFISRSAIIYSLITIILLVGAYVLTRKKIFVGKLIIYKRVRYSILIFLLLLSSSVLSVFKNEKDGKVMNGIPIISKTNNWSNVTYLGFTTNARYKSLMYVWTKQFAKTIMEKPVDYSQSKMTEIVKKYENRSKEINANRGDDLSNQTVIYILSESLANPNRLENVSISQEVLPEISKIQSETSSGLMISNGYGGGTANMEFQTLTGLPLTNYSQNVSILYSEVVPQMKIFPSISDQFDNQSRFVIHPENANNYNRKNIYETLGFNHLIFSGNGNEKLTNLQKTGINPGDAAVYNNILERIDPSESQFFSVITMQNHAPWSVSSPVEVTGEGEGFDEKENANLTEYARLLTHTDNATREFLDSLKSINKKITVVFYGDHLPGFYPISAFKDEPEKQYQTDYFIWSNYQTKKLDYLQVGSSDFIAELLEHTDSKVSPYQALLTDVLLTKKNSSLTKEQEQTLEDLKLVQYDISVGNGYLKDNKQFFSAK